MYSIYNYVYGIDLSNWLENNLTHGHECIMDMPGFEEDYSGDGPAPVWIGAEYGSLEPTKKVPPTYPDQAKLDAVWKPLYQKALDSIKESRAFVTNDPWYQDATRTKDKKEMLDDLDKLETYIKATPPSKVVVYTTS